MMAARPRWTSVGIAALMVGAAVAAARLAADRVDAVLGRTAELVPLPEGPSAQDLHLPEPAPPDTGDPDAPRVDLEHPTERDWRFLLDVLESGTPEGRLSATRALVAIGGLRGVAPLFDATAREPALAHVYCGAALEILRLQLEADALPALLQALVREEPLPSSCRAEVSDRFALLGGRDPEKLAALADHPVPGVRRFVASFLADTDPAGYAQVLSRLAADPDPEVRARARAAAAEEVSP